MGLLLPLVVGCTFDVTAWPPADGAPGGEGGSPRDGAPADQRLDDGAGPTDAAVPADGGALDAAEAGADDAAAPDAGGPDVTVAVDAADDAPVCQPQCDRAVCGGEDGCGGTCHGDNGDPCSAAAETWRCVWIDQFDTWGSQVCRIGVWRTFNLNPQDCGACCGSFSTSCCANDPC